MDCQARRVVVPPRCASARASLAIGTLRALLKSTYGRIPVLRSLAGAALLVAAAGSTVAVDIGVPALVLAGFLAGGLLTRRNADAVGAARLERDAEFASWSTTRRSCGRP